MKYSKSETNQKGASLLEVLIALFILGVGLLGVLAMQAETMKLNQQAYSSSQAMFLANEAVERMRINYAYLSEADRATPPSVDLVFPDRKNWSDVSVATRIPGGDAEGKVTTDGDGVYKVTITYTQQLLSNSDINNQKAEQINYILFARL